MTQIHPERCVTQSLTAHEKANVNHNQFTEHSKLLPWLMLVALLSGLALGMAIMVGNLQNQSENRMREELGNDQRHIQELRARVEDAEMAAKEVNRGFQFPRQPKGK